MSYSFQKKLNNQFLRKRQVSIQYCKTQFSSGQEIPNNHEEADALVIHTLEQMKIGFICNVIEDATDTDLFFLLLRQQSKLILWNKLYISLVREFVNINE